MKFKSQRKLTLLLCTAIVGLVSSCEKPEWTETTSVSTSDSVSSTLGEIDNMARNSNPIGSIVDRAGEFDVSGAGDSLNDLMSGPTITCSSSGTRAPASKSSTSPNINHLNLETLKSTKNLGKNMNLWATNYYLPVVNNDSGENIIVLKTTKETTLSVDGEVAKLSEKEWCWAGMEGSVVIKFKNGKSKTFNYSGTGRSQSKCRMYRGNLGTSTGKAKFKFSYSSFGEGRYYWTTVEKTKWKTNSDKSRTKVKYQARVQRPYALVPYRTLAVDSKKIKPGTIVYIASAKGTKITLPDGKVWTHDGYFFAGDSGGAIKGNHVDVFTGMDNTSKQPFDFIKSSSRGSFNAQVVTDSSIISKMRAMHETKYTW